MESKLKNIDSVTWTRLLLDQWIFILALSLISSAYELYFYGYACRLFRIVGLTIFDWMLLFDTVLAQSLLVTFVWPVIGTCFRNRLPRTCIALIGYGVPFVVVLFFMLDARTQALLGNHLVFYLSLLNQTGSLTYAGETPQRFIVPLVKLLAFATAVPLIWVWANRRSSIPAFIIQNWSLRQVFTTLLATFVLVVLSAVLLRQIAGNPLPLELLCSRFPITIGLFDSQSFADHSETAFDRAITDEFDKIAVDLSAIASVPTRYRLDPNLHIEGSKPHIIIFIVECLRRDAIGPQTMPRINAWADKGLRLTNHYCGSNCSPLGAFSLLYSRTPLAYHSTINSSQSPLFIELLRNSGYNTSLVASCSFDHREMNKFLSKPTFDNEILHTGTGSQWPQLDRQCVSDVRSIIEHADQAPQLIVVYLMSTHFSYQYGDEYSNLLVTPFAGPDHDKIDVGLFERYVRSLRFMDDLLAGFVEQQEANVITLITGDHGESFGEDGVICHGSQLSRVQTQPAFVCVGPGVPVSTVRNATTHLDAVPMLTQVLTHTSVVGSGWHGTDLNAERSDKPQLLVQELPGYWDLLLISNESRLMLRLSRLEPRLTIRGFADEYGQIQANLQRPAREIREWVSKLKEVVNRWSPSS